MHTLQPYLLKLISWFIDLLEMSCHAFAKMDDIRKKIRAAQRKDCRYKNEKTLGEESPQRQKVKREIEGLQKELEVLYTGHGKRAAVVKQLEDANADHESGAAKVKRGLKLIEQGTDEMRAAATEMKKVGEGTVAYLPEAIGTHSIDHSAAATSTDGPPPKRRRVEKPEKVSTGERKALQKTEKTVQPAASSAPSAAASSTVLHDHPVRVATDCSGIEAPIQALQNLGIRFEHVFSSDIDPHARATIRANFASANPEHILYEDMSARDHSQAPGCDLYVAGWPCQGNSRNGKRKGFEDDRSKVFYSVAAYIRHHRPRVVLLENVDNLLKINNGRDFQMVLEELRKLGCYNIDWKVLNTREHGVPQNRPRVYIYCVQKDFDRGTFAWPEPLASPPIEYFLDSRGEKPTLTDAFAPSARRAGETFDAMMEKLKDEDADPLEQPYLFDVACTKSHSHAMYDVCPCILASNQDIWISHYGRMLNRQELCRLQGMNPHKLKAAVSENQFGKQLGNSMSINVLERVLARLLCAAGLAGELPDRWASGEAVAELAATLAPGQV